MIDVSAYLHRIGFDDDPTRLDASAATLRRLHRAHVAAIPFEGLDPLRGRPVSLDLADLQAKLVTGARGGYCFEQNLLLAGVLRELGFVVTPMLGRVGPRDVATRGRTHLLLQVRDRDGGLWHADCGFGASWDAGTPPEPLRFAALEEQVVAGWRYRLESHGGELVLLAVSPDGEWGDVYSFVPEPVAMVDIEMGNWWSCTRPGARFTRLLVVARTEGARRTLLTDAVGESGEPALIEITPDGRTRAPVDRAQVPGMLAQRFGLRGWAWRDGRLEPDGA